jgi:hypothetical protein
MTIVFDKRNDRLYRQPDVNENHFHPVGPMRNPAVLQAARNHPTMRD